MEKNRLQNASPQLSEGGGALAHTQNIF